MNAFDDGFAEVVQDMLDDELWGEAMTYTPKSGDPVNLTGRVGPIMEEEVSDDAGRALRRRRTVVIATDPDADSGGVASPQLSATMTVAAEVWPIASATVAGSFATLELVQVRRIDRSRAGYWERRS